MHQQNRIKSMESEELGNLDRKLYRKTYYKEELHKKNS